MTVSAYHSDMADETEAAHTAVGADAATTVVPPVPGRDDAANSLAWSDTEAMDMHPRTWRSAGVRAGLVIAGAAIVAVAAVVTFSHQRPAQAPAVSASPQPTSSAPMRPAPVKPSTDQQFISRLAAEGIEYQASGRDAVIHNARSICDNLREFGPGSRPQVVAGIQGPTTGLETAQQAYMFLAAAVDYYCPTE